MKWRIFFAVTAALLLILSGALTWYVWGPRRTPPGQPALVDLNAQSFVSFQEQFNRDTGRVRLLVLLSPT